MTILKATTELLRYFVGNEEFSFEDDYKKLVTIEGLEKDEERKKASFLGALDYLTEQKIVQKVILKKKTIWVLTEALRESSVQIDLPFPIALSLRDALTGWLTSSGLEREIDPRKVGRNEIEFAIAIINEYVEIKNSVKEKQSLE